MTLAAWAADPVYTRGRRHKEPPPGERSEFQRDRDRIIHSAAFRRLEYKTQVFVNHEGDLFRTRLTHSIEVAQIGRSIARALALNEDLVEAIALAHDLGHTPFGHAGQDALHECMREHGGFEHNLQSLRVVDLLEERYAAFLGLNLTFETREGILKHCAVKHAEALGDVGRRFLDHTQPTLEAQLANIADEIAYNHHDVDDGLRSGLLTVEGLAEAPLFGRHYHAVRTAHPGVTPRVLLHETVRAMINTVVSDVITTTRSRLRDAGVRHLEEVRQQPVPLFAYSEAVGEEMRGLKRYLRKALYQHTRVRRMTIKAQRLLKEMFTAFHGDPRLLPPQDQMRIAEGEVTPARGVSDYIAGMTDRYAIREHRRLFDPLELT